MLQTALSRNGRSAGSLLNGNDRKSGESNRQRPVNELHGNNRALITIFRDKNSRNGVETAPSDSILLPDAQKWVWCKRNLTIENCHAGSPNSNAIQHATGTQGRNATVGFIASSDQHIAGNEKRIVPASAVAPQCREEDSERNAAMPFTGNSPATFLSHRGRVQIANHHADSISRPGNTPDTRARIAVVSGDTAPPSQSQDRSRNAKFMPPNFNSGSGVEPNFEFLRHLHETTPFGTKAHGFSITASTIYSLKTGGTKIPESETCAYSIPHLALESELNATYWLPQGQPLGEWNLLPEQAQAHQQVAQLESHPNTA